MSFASINNFTCSVCLEVYKNPVRTPCDHIFCKECVSACKSCPMCRGSLPDTFTKDKETERNLRRLTVSCPMCNRTVLLSSYRSHSVECETFHPIRPVVTCHSEMTTDKQPNRMTFNCPYCEKRRLDCGGLLAHLNEKHATERTAAVCPVCAAMPWGNAHQKSSNLIKHFNLRHKFEYDTYVEFERDEGESLRAAIAKSLEDQ